MGLQPSQRANFIADIFKGGLPTALAAMLGIDEQAWLLINVPTSTLVSRAHGMPENIDAIAGRLIARHPCEMEATERRARWHFPRADQEPARRRMATDLALARGLLHPHVGHVVAVQFGLGCDEIPADQAGSALSSLGFAQVLVLVGEQTEHQDNGAYKSVPARVDAIGDDLVLSVEGTEDLDHQRCARRELRGRIHRLLRSVHFPRRLPIVYDLAATPSL